MVHVWTIPGYESIRGVFSDVNPVIACTDGNYFTFPKPTGRRISRTSVRTVRRSHTGRRPTCAGHDASLQLCRPERAVVTGGATGVGAALLDVLAEFDAAHVTVLDVKRPDGPHERGRLHRSR